MRNQQLQLWASVQERAGGGLHGWSPARDALLRRGSAIPHMLSVLTLGETQQNLMQICSVGVPARA